MLYDKKTDVSVQSHCDKMLRILFLFHWRTKIHFKTLKLVKSNYYLPANFIPKSSQLNFLPSFNGNIGNSPDFIIWGARS